MSIRRFNYTKRQRLAHRDVAIYVRDDGASHSFDAAFDLHGYELPTSARVIVEAYRQTTVRRFAFGTVANPQANASTNLEGFGDWSGVLFRAKIVDASGDGRLIAEADRVHAAGPKQGTRRALLRVAEEELNGELWRLTFDAGGPLLLLEKRFTRESLLSSVEFRCFVYPQVFRELLRRALDEWDEDSDEEGSWQSKVVAHGRRLCGREVSENEDDDAQEDWVTAAVTAFCRKHRLVRAYADSIDGGGAES